MSEVLAAKALPRQRSLLEAAAAVAVLAVGQSSTTAMLCSPAGARKGTARRASSHCEETLQIRMGARGALAAGCRRRALSKPPWSALRGVCAGTEGRGQH